MNPDVIRRRIAKLTSEIDQLYWAFTRTKRGKPPILVRPELYKERNELVALLRRLTPRRA